MSASSSEEGPRPSSPPSATRASRTTASARGVDVTATTATGGGGVETCEPTTRRDDRSDGSACRRAALGLALGGSERDAGGAPRSTASAASTAGVSRSSPFAPSTARMAPRAARSASKSSNRLGESSPPSNICRGDVPPAILAMAAADGLGVTRRQSSRAASSISILSTCIVRAPVVASSAPRAAAIGRASCSKSEPTSSPRTGSLLGETANRPAPTPSKLARAGSPLWNFPSAAVRVAFRGEPPRIPSRRDWTRRGPRRARPCGRGRRD